MIWEGRLNLPEAMLLMFMMVLLAGLTITLLSDPYIRRRQKRAVLLIIALIISLIIQNDLEHVLSVGTPRPMLRTLLSAYGYAMRPVPIVLFHYIVGHWKKLRLAWILAAANAGIYLSALFSPAAFRISADNTFVRGPLGFSCHVVTAVLLANFLCMAFRETGREHWHQAVIPVFNSVITIAAVILDAESQNHPVTFLNIAIVSSTVLYYIWLHMRFVKEHEEDLKAQQRIRIMMSQIQPHFLYNTLSTIQALCHTDPEQAAEFTGRFSLYLRQNLDSMSQPGLIPFWKELEHTKTYAAIEETRFGNIRVEYDIRDGDFELPPLTLQPMVENAIRYGVRIRDEGIIRVSTRRAEDCHELAIRDNGAGFDVKKLADMDESHIGIRNVRSRIESMCGGTVTIDSRVGEGTTVMIRIPVRRAADGKKGDE